MPEQPNAKSETGKELKSPEEMRSMSLTDMEKELTSKDYSVYTPANDQEQKDSENQSEEDSTDTEQDDSNTQEDEQSTTEEESDSTTSSDSDKEDSEDDEEEDDSSTESKKTDKQKDKKESNEERLSKLEKNYKELQGDYTRKSQKLKQLEAELAAAKVPKNDASDKASSQEDHEDDPELSQLKEKDPKAYAALNKLVNRLVEKQVKEKVKPVEEAVTLRTRQDNAKAFNKASEEFLQSPLKELESELVGIINENPGEWQRTIWENDKAFELLKKELVYRHTGKVAQLLSQAEKQKQSGATKQDRLKSGQVGTKTKVTQPTRDVTSDAEFKKLSLAEMEKRLPKVRN